LARTGEGGVAEAQRGCRDGKKLKGLRRLAKSF
jgi:hypothetical protein